MHVIEGTRKQPMTRGNAWALVVAGVTLAAMCPTPSGATLTDGLQAYYPFTTSADAANDASGNGRNGTLVNTSWIDDGEPAGARHLGSGSYINIGNALNFASWEQYSISVWFRHDTSAGDTTGYGDKLLCKSAMYSDQYIRVLPASQYFPVGAIHFQASTGGGIYPLAGCTLVWENNFRDNVWHHVAVVRSGPEATMWVDGVARAWTNTAVTITSNTQPIYLGYSPSPDPYMQRPWPGDIDEVRFYNRVLSSNEVTQLAGLQPPVELVVASAQGSPVPAVGTHSIDHGTEVQAGVEASVAAGAGTRHVCAGWTGTGSVPASGDSNTVTFAATAASTLTWQWRTEHEVDATAGAGGSADGAGWYADGAGCTVVADPDDGCHFVRWAEGGTTVSTVSSYSFTVSAPRELTAEFALDEYTLTVSSESPSAGVAVASTTGHGGTTEYGLTVAHGTDVVLEAPESVAAGAGTRHVCAGWTGTGSVPASGDSNAVTFAATAASTLTWQWRTEHEVGATAGAGGSVDGAGWYADGTGCTVVADPDDGCHFVRWAEGGTTVSTDSSYSFTVSGPRGLTAEFALDEYALTVSSEAPAAGVAIASTTGHGGTTDYGLTVAHGTDVALEAPEYVGRWAARTRFVRWDGAGGGTDRTLEFTMLGDRAVTAVYGPAPETAVFNDFDGDGRSDLSVYCKAWGAWYVRPSSAPDPFEELLWGWSETMPVPADYDGDGITDVAVYHPAWGNWYILESGTGASVEVRFGSREMLPVPGDYDGDGKADIAVFWRARGTWFVRPSSAPDPYLEIAWGWSECVPVPADYDGDGLTDVAVYHPAWGNWYVRQSATLALAEVRFGWNRAVPVPADYDGDGKADIAVFHRATADWYVRPSSAPDPYLQWKLGTSTSKPVPGDYDGDGKADAAVYEPATGSWRVRESSTDGVAQQAFGWSAALPVDLRHQIHAGCRLP